VGARDQTAAPENLFHARSTSGVRLWTLDAAAPRAAARQTRFFTPGSKGAGGRPARAGLLVRGAGSLASRGELPRFEEGVALPGSALLEAERD
jgi:hypothetical protein